MITLIIKSIAFYVSALAVCYLAGYALKSLISKDYNHSICEYMSMGFVGILGITELFGWYMIAYSLKKMYFAIMLALVIVGLCTAGIISLKKNPKAKLKRPQKTTKNPYLYAAIAITIIMLALTAVYYRSDADDSFYVSNVTLFSDSTVLNEYDSSFGNTELGTVPMYDFQVWESMAAVISNAFHMEAATLMHTVLIPFLLIMSAMAYVMLGKAMYKGNARKGCIFYVIMSVFHLFSANAVYTEGSFLLSRIWQGKAVYLTMVLPVVTAILLIGIEKRTHTQWILITICMLAGMALNPTSMYVIGFEILFLSLSMAIYKKRICYVLDMIPSGLVAAALALGIYLRTSAFAGQIEAISSATEAFVIDTFKNYCGDVKLFLAIVMVGILAVLLKGNTEQKMYLIGAPLLMLIFVWNPISGKYVAENITMTPSFWRVYWLIPAGEGLAVYVIYLLENVHGTAKRTCTLATACLIIALLGTPMFTENNNFKRVENVEKLPKATIEFGQLITKGNKRPVVLGCEDIATTLRQKYASVELICSRHQYILDLFMYRGAKEDATNRIYLMQVADGMTDDYTRLGELIKEYGIDYIIIKTDNTGTAATLESAGYIAVKECEGYVCYGVEK